MQPLELNAPTVVLLIIVLVLFVFALRRAARVFSGKKNCCGAKDGKRRLRDRFGGGRK